jgi:hypothetical protein
MDLSTSNVDACSLIPNDQKAGLEIDQPPLPGPDPVFGGTQCSNSVAAWGVYIVAVSSSSTASKWLTNSTPSNSTVTSVAGYPAVTTYDPRLVNTCLVVVDTSDRGLIAALISDRRVTATTGRDQLCGRALKAAGIALATLRAKQ